MLCQERGHCQYGYSYYQARHHGKPVCKQIDAGYPLFVLLLVLRDELGRRQAQACSPKDDKHTDCRTHHPEFPILLFGKDMSTNYTGYQNQKFCQGSSGERPKGTRRYPAAYIGCLYQLSNFEHLLYHHLKSNSSYNLI